VKRIAKTIKKWFVAEPRCLRCFNTIAAIALTIWCASAGAQTATNYDALIQQGKSQLDSNAERAATAGKAAIKMSAERWEGYALVGGALMNLKRYEAAADTLSEAIKRAPEAKQAGLRDLRRQCLLAESGSPAAANTAAPATTTSQAEIVLWKSIENSSNPADFSTYLMQYPQGTFVALAQRHVAEIRDQEQGRIQQAASNATWTDLASRLMWTRHDNGRDVDIRDANLDCLQLRLLDYTNWRLPTREELEGVSHLKTKSSRLGEIRGMRDEIQVSETVTFLYFRSANGENYSSTFRLKSGFTAVGGERHVVCVRSAE
jgi:Protein of unknown function (DUF1566)